jgi:hypothetical protein
MSSPVGTGTLGAPPTLSGDKECGGTVTITGVTALTGTSEARLGGWDTMLTVWLK